MGHPTRSRPLAGTSRGLEFVTGGEPQVPVPPYNELRGEPGENTAAKAFDASNPPELGSTPPVSDEERDGVSGTEMNPEPAWRASLLPRLAGPHNRAAHEAGLEPGQSAISGCAAV